MTHSLLRSLGVSRHFEGGGDGAAVGQEEEIFRHPARRSQKSSGAKRQGGAAEQVWSSEAVKLSGNNGQWKRELVSMENQRPPAVFRAGQGRTSR